MLFRLAQAAKGDIVTRVRQLFNDPDVGETPVERSPDALFASTSVIWRVHGDVTSMMVGGICALLLQMLHPAVLAGVWDHSNFRTDMIGRLRRTGRFIALTTYGDRELANAAVARVRAVHENVSGTWQTASPIARTIRHFWRGFMSARQSVFSTPGSFTATDI